MFAYIWPIALVIASNILYQICARGIPQGMNTLASMTVTYLTGAACSGIMFFFIFSPINDSII